MAKRSKSAMKRVKTSKKRKARNLAAKGVIKKSLKLAERAIASKADGVKDLIKKAISAIDKAVQRGIIHKKRAARKKSRLLLKFNIIK